MNVSRHGDAGLRLEIGQVTQPIEDAIEAYLLTVRQAWDTNTSATSVVYEANVYLARITAAIVGVTGVVNATNVQLNGGTADLILTESGTTQQVPVLGTVSLSAGTDYEMLKLLPPWYREILDYREICRTEEAQLEALAGEITSVADNFFFRPWTCPRLRCGSGFFSIVPNLRRRMRSSGDTGY